MCCCDEDIIALLCVGVPMIVYAVLVGFPKRNPCELAKKLFKSQKNVDSPGCNASVDSDLYRLFIFIAIVAVICIVYGIAVTIIRCLLCCCSCCCGCPDCFLKYAYRVGVGVGFPALIDFLTYLLSASVSKGGGNSFNNTIGSYSGLSMVSLAGGWVFTILVGSFFIQKDSCCLKFLGLILGCMVSFLIIAIVVPFDTKWGSGKSAPWTGVFLGFMNVGIFTGMYASSLCCLGGCCK